MDELDERAYWERLSAVNAEIARLQDEVLTLSAHAVENDSLSGALGMCGDLITRLQRPCACDPPGSGVEACNGACRIREALIREMVTSGRVSHGNTNVLQMFDAVLQAVREGNA